MEDDQLLTRRDAAALLVTPVSTLSQWAYLGKGPSFYRVGRRVLYKRSDLTLWLERQRVCPGGPSVERDHEPGRVRVRPPSRI